MNENYTTEFTNMVMIRRKDGCVLVQERVKYWKGIAFPGGHVEPGERFDSSAVREVREETGLDIQSPRLCGVIHWDNPVKREKYIVFAYRADKFTGELLESTDEGRVFWVKPEELTALPLCPNFEKYLPIFFSEQPAEFYEEYH